MYEQAKKLSSKIHNKGAVGENHLWDGPLDTSSFPKGQGSSNGKNGIKLKCDTPVYIGGPITTRVKNK